MQHLVHQDPIAGCVFERPTAWTGSCRLVGCASDVQFSRLQTIPGVWSRDSKKRPELNGWYLPTSLIEKGRHPANLNDYPEETYRQAPSGLYLQRHQLRSVTFLRRVSPEREGALLVAEMGLGKTNSALHALWLDGYLQRPGIVIAPKIARGVWCDEDSDAKRHYNLTIQPLEGVKALDPSVLSQHYCFFCNYEILSSWQTWIFHRLRPAWLIADEIHYCIHQKAQRAQAARELSLCSSIERRIGLTGTPIPNERMDLWSQLAVVQPRQWGTTKHFFGLRYCRGERMTEEQGGHWDYSGESHNEELRARLAGTFLCYMTEDISDELPPMRRHILEVSIADNPLASEYSAAQRDVSAYLKSKNPDGNTSEVLKIGSHELKLSKNDRKPGAARLVCLTTLIGIISEMKRYGTLGAIQTILGQHNRLVVFSLRRKTAKWVYEQLIAHLHQGGTISGKRPVVYGPVHGEMPMATRKLLAEQFAKDHCSIYVATIGGAGTSINTLSAASSMLMVDLHWNTTSLRQAEKRVHRIGCTAPQVDIYYLIARGTVDDLFLEKIEWKANVAHGISKQDAGGIGLVRDLVPDKERDEIDLDLMCERLMQDA
jgi:SNF2 family DNA or RNA helicase